ncbi:cold shock domain-containing protein [Streptomyces sp. NPDC048484]|uniref:cold-shock protein n=1 Tax=Streptomyces sp. NPDC048484 TaxID=3155146 RepID=UPI00343FD7F0
MVVGKIARFDETRGYGFITPEGGGSDVFMHANDLLSDKQLFTRGVLVEFEMRESDRGLKAFAVRIVEESYTDLSSTPAADQPELTGDRRVDDMCDALSTAEFMQEVTDVIIERVPTATSEQIVQFRQSLATIARSHGWLED